MNAVCPVIADKGRLDLDLREARHPLLLPALVERLGLERRTTREPVPVSITVGFGKPVLVISGPNTGRQDGRPEDRRPAGVDGAVRPARPRRRGQRAPRLPACLRGHRRRAVDLGQPVDLLRAPGRHRRDDSRPATPALVLLDEVGAGTDPAEGGALGTAVVDLFRRRGAMVVATTHHGLLKAYAQSTPDVACASFGYDPATYEPTYRLALGVAGRSLALEMAERLGLDPRRRRGRARAARPEGRAGGGAPQAARGRAGTAALRPGAARAGAGGAARGARAAARRRAGDGRAAPQRDRVVPQGAAPAAASCWRARRPTPSPPRSRRSRPRPPRGPARPRPARPAARPCGAIREARDEALAPDGLGEAPCPRNPRRRMCPLRSACAPACGRWA